MAMHLIRGVMVRVVMMILSTHDQFEGFLLLSLLNGLHDGLLVHLHADLMLLLVLQPLKHLHDVSGTELAADFKARRPPVLGGAPQYSTYSGIVLVIAIGELLIV
jgi:hypothetical protein